MNLLGNNSCVVLMASKDISLFHRLPPFTSYYSPSSCCCFSKSNLCIFVAFVMIPDCESGAVATCSTFYPCSSSPRISHHVQHCPKKRGVCLCASYLQAFLMSHASNKRRKCEYKMIRELCSCSHIVLIFSCWQESSSSAASFWEPHADFNRRDIESSSTAWLCFHWLNVIAHLQNPNRLFR